MVEFTCVDDKSGEISLTNGFKIGSSLTREALLSSPLGEKAENWGTHDPWFHYRIIAASSDGTPFIFVLSFCEGNLYEVSLSIDSPEFGSSWEDWSEERERNRKAQHDTWLRKIGIIDQIYHWGRIDSVFDEQTGGSSIIIKFSEHSRYETIRPPASPRKRGEPGNS